MTISFKCKLNSYCLVVTVYNSTSYRCIRQKKRSSVSQALFLKKKKTECERDEFFFTSDCFLTKFSLTKI